MNKNLTSIILGLIGVIFSVSPVLAHVVVKPGETNVASWQTFSVGVPNEKDSATISLRLVLPSGLKSVSPNVKPGWKVDVKKTGEGESAQATEITWTGGSIPAGQRDDFLFSAQVPAEETTLKWKAYQTYQNGIVVSWDQEPQQKEEKDDDMSNSGPYSQTKIVDDLRPSSMPDQEKLSTVDKSSRLSLAALILSVLSLGMQLVKKKAT